MTTLRKFFLGRWWVALSEVFVCPECGPLVDVDEDGCCHTCGASASIEANEPKPGYEPEEKSPT